MWAYEVASPPAAYATISTAVRGNVYVDGETLLFTFNKNVTGTYVVRDYYGATVTSGSLTAQNTLTPATPGGGWKRGWYRLYLLGGVDNAGYGFSLGATNFCIVANDARFTPRPSAALVVFPVDFQGEAPELPLKGFLGLGTSRLVIKDAANPSGDSWDNIASVQAALDASNTYWSTGAEHRGPDPVRPRNPYVVFTNSSVDNVYVPGEWPTDQLYVIWRDASVAVSRGELWIALTAGSVSGVKYTFMWPGSDAEVGGSEVHDNVGSTIREAVAYFENHPKIRVYRANDRDSSNPVTPGTAVSTYQQQFVGGLDSWAAAGGSSVALNSGVFHFEGNSVLATLPTASAGANPGAQRTSVISVTSGQSVRASAWVAGTAGKVVTISMTGQTFSGTVATTVTLTGAMQRVTWKGTATSTGAATMTVYTTSATTAGQLLYVDDVSVMTAHTLRPLENKKYHGVKQVVSTFYPQGIEWYEGPENEPDMRKNPNRYSADTMLFHQAVKAGHPLAKSMGPSMVDINASTYYDYPGSMDRDNVGFDSVYRWAVGGQPTGTNGPSVAARDYLDGFTTHVYNFCNGDISAGRRQIEHLEFALKECGIDHLPRWQGEQGVITPVYGVYHPRRARWQLLWDFLLEQAGIPRERNNLWYDESHGFWAFPSWWMNGNKGLNPHAVMQRVWSEEVYGHAFEERLTFGTGIGERMFTGNVYVSPSGTRRIGFLCTSHLDNQTVVLQLAGTIPASITWRTPFGVDNTIAPDADGRIEVPVSAEPTWVRLPAGTTATVHTFLGLSNMNVQNLAGDSASAMYDGLRATSEVVDNQWPRAYAALAEFDGVDIVSPLPVNLSILFHRKVRVTHVIPFSGAVWQSRSALVDFDIQTTANNGGSWTTRKTVTRTADSIKHGTGADDTGCQRDTYYDEAWVFPVKLDTPIDCNGVRLVVRAASYGGEPDAASLAAGGQGSGQNLTLSEVYVIGDTPPRRAGLP